MDRGAESLDFTGFLIPKFSESVQRRWIPVGDTEQGSLTFVDRFSGFFGIVESAVYNKRTWVNMLDLRVISRNVDDFLNFFLSNFCNQLFLILSTK